METVRNRRRLSHAPIGGRRSDSGHGSAADRAASPPGGLAIAPTVHEHGAKNMLYFPSYPNFPFCHFSRSLN